MIFKGENGVLTKDCLIKLPEHCSSDENISKSWCVERDEGMDVVFEIEILQSKMASMQALIASQIDPTPNTVSDLSRQVARLQIDLEEEKVTVF